MSDKKQVFLSLETARKMWESQLINLKEDIKNDPICNFLLDNFTKKELEAEKAKSLENWNERQ